MLLWILWCHLRFTRTRIICVVTMYTQRIPWMKRKITPLSIHSFPVFLDILVIQFINFFVYFLFSIISYSLSWLYYDGVHLFTFNYYFASSFIHIIIFLKHPLPVFLKIRVVQCVDIFFDFLFAVISLSLSW